MSFKQYLKRGIKYVFFDKKPKVIYVTPALVKYDDMFKDKVILVTGGSEGIGYSIAKRFKSLGAKVIITGRNHEKLKKVCHELKLDDYYQNDISDIDKQKELLDYIDGKFGKINILVNNAGISKHEKDFLTVTERDFDEQFDINLKGSYFLTQKLIKKYNSDLNIIFITSERGDQCDYLPYGLTKKALNSLIEGISCRFYTENIRVNGVAPGITASNMTKISSEGDMYSDCLISERFFNADEVAECVCYLASDFSKCISGEILHSNGGNHLNPWFK